MNFNPFTGDGRLNRGNADLHVLEPLAPQEIISAYLSSELVRRAVDKPAQDLASAGISLSLDGDESGEEIAQSFAEYLKRLDFSGHLFQALSAARLWGGAGLIVWADDGLPMDEPLDLANCRTIRALTVASRWELIPVEWGDDPTVERGRLNEPVLYRYTPHVRQASASTRSDFRSWHQYLRRGKKIHATRVLGFVGKKIPRLHNMMGLSSGFDFVLGSGWEGDTVYRALKARAADMATVFSSSSEFVRTASALILKSPEVRDVIEAFSQDDPGNPIKEKLEALRLRMNAFGLTAIAPDEEIVEVSRTAQGMQQLIDTVMVGLSAACYPSIPITFLFGLQPPGGLSGAGEADINNYYRALSEIRTQQYMGELRWLAKIVLSCQDGPTAGQVPAVWDLMPGEFGSQSEAEKLELESKRAALLKEYVDLRAIAPEEIRANLKSQENPLIQLSDEYDEALKTPDPGAADAGAQPDMGGMSALMGQQTAQEPTDAAQGMQPGQVQGIEQAAPQVSAQDQETTPTRQDEGDEEMKPIRLADGRIVVPQVLIVEADSAEAGLLSLAARQATQQEEASIRFASQPSPVRMDETRFVTMKHHLEGEKGHVVPVEVDSKEGGGQTWSLPSGKTLELSPEKAKAHELKRAAIAKKIAATSKSPAVIAHHKQVAEEIEAKHAPKPAPKVPRVPRAKAAPKVSTPQPETAPKPAQTGKIRTTENAPPAEAKEVYEALLERFPKAEIWHDSSATGKTRRVSRSTSASAIDEHSKWPQSVYFEAGQIHVHDHAPRSSEPFWKEDGQADAKRVINDHATQKGTYGHTPDELVSASGKVGQYLRERPGIGSTQVLLNDLDAYAKGQRNDRMIHRLQAAGVDLARVEESAKLKPKPAPTSSAAPVVAQSHADVLKRIGHAITKDMSRYGITGVYYHINKNKQPYAVATDGNRLSMVPIDANNEHMNKMIRADGEHAEFEEFPDYEQVMPKNPNLEDINRASLSNAVQAIRKLFRSVPKPELASLKGIHDKTQRSKIDKANRNALADHEYATSHIEFHNVNGDLYIKPKHIEGHQEYAGPSPKGLNNVVGMNVHYLNDVLASMPKNASIKISFGQDRIEKMRNDNAIQINGSDGSKHIIMPIR